jgi:hypothetical protein
VVLPAPLGPTRPATLPMGSLKVQSCNAQSLRYRLPRCEVSKAWIMPHAPFSETVERSW